MVIKLLPISWSNTAKASLRQIYTFIRTEAKSKRTADLAKEVILNQVEKIPTMPRSYPLEPFLTGLDGEFRFTIAFSYKIIFEIEEARISILDIFHMSRNPQEIENLKK